MKKIVAILLAVLMMIPAFALGEKRRQDRRV